MAMVKVSLGSAATLVYFRVFFPDALTLSISDVALEEIIPVQNSTELVEVYDKNGCGRYQKVDHSKSIVLVYLTIACTGGYSCVCNVFDRHCFSDYRCHSSPYNCFVEL